jgi:hypothetical protein
MKPTERHSTPPDPIVDEVRSIRRELSARFANDVGKLCEHLRQIEAGYSNRLVQPRRSSLTHQRKATSAERGSA